MRITFNRITQYVLRNTKNRITQYGQEVIKMTKTQQNRQNKYIDDHYDRINLTVPKGMKEKIQAYAIEHNESVNSLINRLLDAEISKPTKENLTDPQQFADFGGTNEDEKEEYLLPWENEPPKHSYANNTRKTWIFD